MPYLNKKQATQFLNDLVQGKLVEGKIIDQLTEMANRGETVEEITGMAQAMRALMVPVTTAYPVIDTCGTGGSGLNRINTSTLVAFILAADDIYVAKHGNKAASGRCGSFDVLENLGVNIELKAEEIKSSLQKTHLGFIYARLFHPAMKIINPIREKIGKRTIFNLLGPLLNPAKASKQLMGVNNLETAQKMIHVLRNLQLKRVLVVIGSDGLDEITLTGDTTIMELRNGEITQTTITPESVGLSKVSRQQIEGGSVELNASIFRDILENRAKKPYLDLVLFNAGAGFYLADKASSIAEGVNRARIILESGAAQQKFLDYRLFSQNLK